MVIGMHKQSQYILGEARWQHKPMWVKQTLSVFLLLVVSSTMTAQRTASCDFELKGVFLDIETHEPIPFVYVKVQETNQYAIAGEDGSFALKGLCQSCHSLSISCIGYGDTICKNCQNHQNSHYIYLTKSDRSLAEVSIVAEKNKAEGIVSISQQTIDKESLSADLTQSLASALSEIEGVTFASTGNNVQLPVIHGLYGNRILILNNGIKHGFQNWGTDHAPEIDVASANSVTIVKGAAGVRYGPEALGGAIIVEAAPLNFNQAFSGQVGAGYQTNGKGYVTNASVGRGLENWSYHLGANYTRIGDRHAPTYSLTNTGKEEMSFNGGVRYQVGRWDVRAYYSFVDQNLGLLRSSVAHSGTAIVQGLNAEMPVIIKPFSYDINEPNQLVQHHLGKVEANWWYRDEAKLTVRFGSQLNKREEYDVRRNVDKPIINLDLITNDFQIEWKHPVWSGLNGMVGLQTFTQNNDNNPGTDVTAFIPNYNTYRQSGYIIESFKQGNHTIELGARLDYEYNNVRGRKTNQDIFRDQYSFINLTSSLGYIHQISSNSSFRTNIGTAWRTPNMAELYSFGQHGFKTSFGLLRYYTDGDGALRTNRVIAINESNVSPERGYKWINEWRAQWDAQALTFTFYTHYIENFIFDRPLAVIGTVRGPMPAFIYDQANALFAGADLSWQTQWSRSLSGTLGMSYLWSRNLKKNEALINQPPITTSYNLIWNTRSLWKVSSSQLSIKPSYTFRQFQAPMTIRPEELIEGTVMVTPESEIFDFKDAPEGYFLLDIAWRFQLGRQLNASLSVQNVLNARYRNYLNDMRYFADEPGRNVLFTLNYTFNSKPN